MVDYPILRFVANAGDTTARLDLNDGTTWTTDHEGFDLGAPAYDADAFAIGALYDLRTVTFTPRARGGPAAVFPALSALAVELQRNRNWLMFQFDADSKPFWLRTYKSELTALGLEDVYVGRDSSSWQRPVTLRCDPFARGEAVSLAPVSVGNDPSAGGVAYVLPTIEGDAPAPLNVLIEGMTADNIKAPMVSTSATEQPYTPPLVASNWQYAVLNGQPQVVVDAAYIAGQYISVPDDWPLTLTVTPPFAGRYKAYLRAGFSDSTTEWDLDCGGGNVRVTQRSIGNENTEPWNHWGTTGSQGWIDLGTVTLGAGWTPFLNPTLDTDVTLNVTKLSGAGAIRLDVMMFVPVDETEGTIEGRTLKVDPLLVPTGALTDFYIDGENREMWAQVDPAGTANWEPYILGGLAGRFPQVIPGRQNTLHLLRNVDTGTDVKGDTTRLTISYFPRRLDPLGI